jgi:hypothetical protein
MDVDVHVKNGLRNLMRWICVGFSLCGFGFDDK